MMILQPFYICDNLLFFVTGSIVLGCDFSVPEKYDFIRISVPFKPGSLFYGISFDMRKCRLAVMDMVHCNIILSDIEPGRQFEKIIHLKLSPRTAAFVKDRFWLTLQKGDFETILAYIENDELHELDIESKWDGENINLVGFPIVISCNEYVVLCNFLLNRLFFIDENINVINKIEIQHDSIIGPTALGNVVVLEQTDNSYYIYVVDAQANKTVIRKEAKVSDKHIEGITITKNGTVVITTGSEIYYSLPGKPFKAISLPLAMLTWEAYFEQAQNKPEQ